MIMNTGSFLNRITSFFGLNTNNMARGTNSITDFKTVLLVDEADVFFDKKYYGSAYRPAIRLKDQSVTDLLKYVWKLVQSKKQIHQS